MLRKCPETLRQKLYQIFAILRAQYYQIALFIQGIYFCMETRQMVDVLWVPPGPSPSNLAEVQTPTHTFISFTRSQNQVSLMGAKNIWR